MTIHDLTLEQMKEIVDGVPDECAYYSLVNNIVIYYQWCEEWFWHNPNTNEYERDFSKSMKFSLNDLRTAIAQHDEGQNVMDKPKTYNEWHSSLKDFEGLRHANCCKISYEAGQQSRQAEVDEKDKRIAELKLWNSNQSQTVKLKELSIEQLKELLQQLIDDEYTTMRPSIAYEIQKALRGEHE
ncbi:hypothetical protein QR665_19830 [Acinetobacter gerneri]|uniref:hypothetical protein n=1 Tax=Acinetobacter gerneri TaxID=202952 RepID=UPI0029365165|nr:hypothetical protein [Acinetobacter gerneri]MDV2441683.1 hypothetical protein [Acinetobacter gerneri]